jgi:hypothetical protein
MKLGRVPATERIFCRTPMMLESYEKADISLMRSIDSLLAHGPHLQPRQVPQAGKAVFVEKPLSLTRAQIDEVWKAGAGDDAQLAIGFNRPLAPLSQCPHEEISQVNDHHFLDYANWLCGTPSSVFPAPLTQ